jgi:hypothetical protein
MAALPGSNTMKSIYPLFFLLLAAALAGCFGGGGKATVKGKVTCGPKTVKFGEVVIYGGDGIPKTGKINRDGTYQVDDVISGQGKIAVRSVHPREVASIGRDEKAKPDPEDVKNYFPLPAKYADANSSGLTLTIKAGENSHDITLSESAEPGVPRH